MHETAIAASIIASAKQGALKKGAVKSLSLEVGELAPLSPKETKEWVHKLSDWKVSVKAIKAAIACKCGFKGRPKVLQREHDFVLYCCPKCGCSPKLKAGNAYFIRKIVVEKPKSLKSKTAKKKGK